MGTEKLKIEENAIKRVEENFQWKTVNTTIKRVLDNKISTV